MGIYDRDYLRDERAPRGTPSRGRIGGGWRSWSVNTWLILICVAVFVIDGFMPTRLVPMETVIDADKAEQLEGLPVDKLRSGKVAVLQGGRIVREPLFAPTADGQLIQVGYNEYANMQLIEAYLHFSTQLGFIEIQFWRFIGFQFLHSHQMLAHIVFNMLGLYFFGPIVERYLGSKRYLAFYLLCGIFGAIMYLILNLGGHVATIVLGADATIPGLLFDRTTTELIGASAGVFGVLMAGAYLAPNAIVLLFFVIPMKLRTLAYALVVLALFTVITGGQNAGGEAGHLGGAIAGFYFIRRPHHLHGFFDFLGRVDPTSHHYRKPGGGGPKRAEINRVLDKISQEGIHSLTEREKKLLQRASEEGRT